MLRRNRNLQWGSEKMTEPEKVVGFRMPLSSYEALKLLAQKARKPMAVLINEALEKHFKLSKKKVRIEK